MGTNDFLTKLGRRIIEIRNEKGIRQIDLAIDSELDDGSLRRIEAGRTNPTVKTLIKIAKGLGVKTKDLLDFEE